MSTKHVWSQSCSIFSYIYFQLNITIKDILEKFVISEFKFALLIICVWDWVQVVWNSFPPYGNSQELENDRKTKVCLNKNK